VLHVDPFASPHTPPLHVVPEMQSALVEHDVLHVVPPHL
jgi:hypothetical protein